MSRIKSEVETANAAYAKDFDKGDLALPPARGFLVLTCMDARLDPAKYAGLSEGDAHVVRNAGGRATDDAIRSIALYCDLVSAAVLDGLQQEAIRSGSDLGEAVDAPVEEIAEAVAETAPAPAVEAAVEQPASE